MNKFSLIMKKNTKSADIGKKIKNELIANDWIYDEENPTLVICIGGDGTLLYAVHKYMQKLGKIHFTAIHTGTLGFFTDYTEAEVDDCIYDILNKKPTIIESNLLTVHINGDDSHPYYALNEVRIENVIKTQILDIFIDDEYFQTFRGTGMCISTQAGSTAYNRSLKGAVVDTDLKIMQISEITGIHHSQYRSLGVPLILQADRTINIKSATFDSAILCYDHLHTELKGAHELTITLSPLKVKFARYKKYSYIKRLKNLY
ncbi:MAG: NAD kinase [Erysipelotrichaceae bacterium]